MTTWTLHDAAQTIEFGTALGALLMPGDVLILDGPLGAGKTTLTKGIARGIGVEDAITSPTFVIARAYAGQRALLVHADAYRLGSHIEFDDLGLDADLDSSIIVVEWGEGRAEGLTEDPLYVRIRPQDDGDIRELALQGESQHWGQVIDALRGWMP